MRVRRSPWGGRTGRDSTNLIVETKQKDVKRILVKWYVGSGFCDQREDGISFSYNRTRDGGKSPSPSVQGKNEGLGRLMKE